MKTVLVVCLAAAAAVAISAMAADKPAPGAAKPGAANVSAGKPYRVVDGKVDAATFRGWQAYHSSCHTCHGVDALGTNIAPSLVERVKDLSAHDFTVKVLTSYRLVFGSSELGDDSTAVREKFVEDVLRRERGELIMPAWQGDPNVRPNVLDLYAYLRARADGALGPGKPKPLSQ